MGRSSTSAPAMRYAGQRGLSAKVEYEDLKEDDALAGAARKPDTRKIWLTLIYDFE